MATVLVSLQGQFSLHQSRNHIRTVHTKVGVRSPPHPKVPIPLGFPVSPIVRGPPNDDSATQLPTILTSSVPHTFAVWHAAVRPAPGCAFP